MTDTPFIPAFLIGLIIAIIITRIYMKIAGFIGETIRGFFVDLWKRIKN